MRILLVADTHIGIDMPRKPKVARRRRGPDFLANFRRALEPALNGEVDIVVHGGDLLFRSKVPPETVEMAMMPLVEVASRGIPIYLVPGNHERSRIPTHLWANHPAIHIFDRPRTFVRKIHDRTIALAGFPFMRDIRNRFGSVLRETGIDEVDADAAILCIHQAVEGAQVGPVDFTFRHGADVIRGRDIPEQFCAVLSGHIHRSQVLQQDLGGVSLGAPVVYPGAVERTSWAEREEAKRFGILTVEAERGSRVGRLSDIEWVSLPARPMVDVVLEPATEGAALEAELRLRLSMLPADAVVRVHFDGQWTERAQVLLSAAKLRGLAPPTMNISLHGFRARRGATSVRLGAELPDSKQTVPL